MTPVMTARDTVEAQYYRFWLAEDVPTGNETPLSNNGLVERVPGAAAIITGVHSGPVDVTVEAHDAAPEVDSTGWDEIVEFTVWSAEGRLRLVEPLTDGPAGIPDLSVFGEGGYRVRVHARGRDTAPDRAVSEPVESYLITLWSNDGDELDPENVHKQTDRCGALRRANHSS